MSTIQIIKDEERGRHHLAVIYEVTDIHTRALGFLPYRAYEEALSIGRLWILADDRGYCGHLLFGGAHPTLKIKQLFVAPSARRGGLARLLIDELVTHAERAGFASIRARVADDLEANAAWDRLGFSTQLVVRGGASTGRAINVRYRRILPSGPQTHFLAALDQASQTLTFTARGMPLNRDHWYTVDLNVWLDFARDRPPFNTSARALVESASRGLFRLRFTREAIEEAKRSAGGRGEDPLLAVAMAWQVLPEDDGVELDALVEDLRALIFPDRARDGRRAANDTSDLRHLAMSIRAGASGFLTREQALLRHRDTLWRRFRLDVLTPSDLVEGGDDTGSARSVLLSNLKVDLIAKCWSRAADAVVRLAQRGARLRALDREDEGWVVAESETVAGLVYWRRAHRNDVEAFLALDPTIGLDAASHQRIFDILVGLVTAESITACPLARLILQTDAETGDRYREDLLRLGFFATREPDRYVCFRSGDPLGLSNWEQARGAVEQEIGAASTWLGGLGDGAVLRLTQGTVRHELDRFEFETRFGITALTLSGRSGYYVPITRHLANELLPRQRCPELFQEHDASYRIERVYFRRARGSGGPERGDLIFFYVSSPLQAIVGAARCTASQNLDADEANARFRRLAVLNPANIGPEVHCIAFDNYIHLRQPVERRWLRERGAIPKQDMITVAKLPDTIDAASILVHGLRHGS